MGRQIRNAAIQDPKVVAIGELGLDLYKADNENCQRIALQSQLEIALQLEKPVIIHCREAARELKAILQSFWMEFAPLHGVMHCWSGTPEETEWFLDLGLYISFSGIATFKNAATVHASAQMVPSDRLLVETDCPFLAPAPHRGKRNEPAYVRHVAERIAQLRGELLDDLAERTTANACQLFRLSLN
jgi:TatD DNase family protein